MSDEAILQLVKSIDDRTARMETSINLTLQKHKEDDEIKHDEFDRRFKSLETSRTAARAGLAALALGGTGGAAKMGFLDKLISIFATGGT
jgi:hypothetical protein